jgi:glycosyltransferase involved in cell wall biosynthesis
MTKISLIVCTKNRATYLPAALSALSKLVTEEPWQLIIVDNGSNDGTAEVLRKFAAADPLHISLIYESVPGLANAQNAGLRHADGEILAFTDDDCYPEPDYLNQIRDCFQEGALDYLGGRVLLYDKTDAPITIQTRSSRVEFPPRSYIPSGSIHGAAFAFSRKAMAALGGFDPALGIGGLLDSGNDLNALIRCSAFGFRGAYDPRPVVFHHHRRKSADDVGKLMKRYDVSRGAAFWLGLSNRNTRMAYLWPALRRVCGNLLKGHWATMSREVSGAYRYSKLLSQRTRSQNP